MHDLVGKTRGKNLEIGEGVILIALAFFVSALLLATNSLLLPATADAATAAQFTIQDDGNGQGGDCYLIGTWTQSTKTCVLTQDVTVNNSNDGLWVATDGITLDGNSHVVSGKDAADTAGVRVVNGTGSSVKNLGATHFATGVQLDPLTDGVTVEGVTASSNLQNGISVSGPNNIIINNTLVSNTNADIYLYAAGNTTVSGNTITGNHISSNGIYLSSSSANLITGNSINTSHVGIAHFPGSSANTISGNTLADNDVGVSFGAGSNNNNFTENTVSSSGPGSVFRIDASDNNALFRNNFLTAAGGDSITNGSTGNALNLPLPSGGNYWARYDSPAEGCSDANGDFFCDGAYDFTGGSDGLPWTRQGWWASSSYYWTWYDNFSSLNWLLMANPAGAQKTVSYDYQVGSNDMSLYADSPPNGSIAAGASAPARFYNNSGPFVNMGMVGGPVRATSTTGTKAIASQRSLWKGGNSLEEVLGTEETEQSDHYYWTWYDNRSPGTYNWVMVSNTSGTDTYYEIRVGGNVPSAGQTLEGSATGFISPGQSMSARFNLRTGPVEVLTYTGSDKATPKQSIASQRVLTNTGTPSEAFNEVPGIPGSDLSNDYLWTWYDNVSPGAYDWVLVANPNPHEIQYRITVNGAVPSQMMMIEGSPTGTIAAGSNVTPRINAIDGPLEVRTCKETFNQDGTCSDPTVTDGRSIASQRTLWGPSFEEVPGYPRSALTSDYHWTWYDQFDAGTYNWIHIINTNPTPVHYQITVGGIAPSPAVEGSASGLIAPGQLVHPRFLLRGGPVEVKSCSQAFVNGSCPDATPPTFMTSQRVIWHGYFNEVLGTDLG